MVVRLDRTHGLRAEPPRALFLTRLAPFSSTMTGHSQYNVAPDGRFLLNEPLDDSPIKVIVNWPSLLQRR